MKIVAPKPFMYNSLHNIQSPTFVLQGKLDDPLYQESANIIYNAGNANKKEIKWYEKSSDIITLGIEREQINEDSSFFRFPKLEQFKSR